MHSDFSLKKKYIPTWYLYIIPYILCIRVWTVSDLRVIIHLNIVFTWDNVASGITRERFFCVGVCRKTAAAAAFVYYFTPSARTCVYCHLLPCLPLLSCLPFRVQRCGRISFDKDPV